MDEMSIPDDAPLDNPTGNNYSGERKPRRTYI
jgi:hypothetical protein